MGLILLFIERISKISTLIIRNKLIPYIEIKSGAEDIYSVRKHSHKELSVGFIEGGSSKITCKELEFILNVNQSIIIPPETVHLCEPDDPLKFNFRMIYISKDWFDETFGVNSGNLKPCQVTLNDSTLELINKFIEIFDNELDGLKIESETIKFLDEIFFNVFSITENIVDNKDSKNLTVEPLKDYIDLNFKEEIRLDDLTEITNENKFKIIREFNKKYRLTPHAYLINKRIEYAKDLLLAGSSVAETAVSSGFFDQSHFIKTFRNFIGVNPIDYKKK
ncbi:MAG: AraC family transcriptional regulator [Desulfobacterales bacterium]|nr:AraC family transcriptional regulator [Desulfobacterales bacterium]MCP4158831.1 AraC family transcriptional regulator [Deltaproteobacteria bacterium]